MRLAAIVLGMLLVVSAAGAAPLHDAAERGDAKAVRRLVDQGADLAATDDDGRTPLLAAVLARQPAAMRTLIAAGAGVNQATTLSPEVLKRYGEGAPEETVEITPLLAAVFVGDTELVRLLTEQGADVNTATRQAARPLSIAALYGRTEITEVLLDRGADITATVENGDTPLHLAAQQGRRAVVKLLLQRGADPNHANQVGDKPLHSAARRGDIEMVRSLLAHGANADVSDENGVTPLLSAVAGGHLQIARLLLDNGAHPGREDQDGVTPLLAARERDDDATIALLEAHGASGGSAIVPDSLSAPIDTHGSNPYASAWVAAGERWDADRSEPRGIAVDAAAATLYWTEYAADRIVGAVLDGSKSAALALGRVDGPIGIAVGGGWIYWTTDGSYPRSVEVAKIDGTQRRRIASGSDVNRPGAIAVDHTTGDVYWTEAVSGRIRRAVRDVSSLRDLFTDGISSIADRPNYEFFVAWGLAVDVTAGMMYWTEITAPEVRRAKLDGTRVITLLDDGDGLDLPAGIALDPGRGKLYWTDPGLESIQRANLDGSGVEQVLGADDGLIAPVAIAIDGAAGMIYWADAATDAIARAQLDGSGVESIRPAAKRPAVVAARAAGGTTGADRCQRNLDAAAQRYVTRVVNAVSTCLRKVDALKAVKRTEADAAKAIPICAAQLARLHDQEPAGLSGWFLAHVRSLCEASTGIDPKAVERAGRDLAYAVVAARHLRAREWLEEVRPFLAAAAGQKGGQTGRALASLDDLFAALGRAANPPQASGPGLPATGMSTSYHAVRARAADHVGVADDGAVRAGAPLRFADNGDGTITDLNTGLMWEKKCDCSGNLHDYRQTFAWTSSSNARTIWDWLDDINSEGQAGFAGFGDWRIPNVKELLSIVDYERFNPAVTTAFDGALCGLTCTDLSDPRCSCTNMSQHWTSTTFANAPSNAVVLPFNLGLVGNDEKREAHSVRAVRDGQRRRGSS